MRQGIYDLYADRLALLAAERRTHLADGCHAEPMCIGPVHMRVLSALIMIKPSEMKMMLLAAVGEIDQLTQSRDAVRLALVAEKARTADLRERLKVWEDSADVLGPIIAPQ